MQLVARLKQLDKAIVLDKAIMLDKAIVKRESGRNALASAV